MISPFHHKEQKNYHTATNLIKLYTSEDTSDVHFLFTDEHKKIPAHKCLLAVASPVFMKMFYGELKEPGDVEIVDASHDAFLEFLQFFYCDKFDLSTDNICEVMTMADKYDVAGLMNLCAIFLERNIRIETVCWIYDLALSFNLTHLIKICEDKICLETGAVLSTYAFRQCSQRVLSSILEMNELSCDEILIYKRTMDWATEACQRSNIVPNIENKKLELGYCFELLRFPTMSSEDFTQCIAEDGLFEASEFLNILGYLTLKRKIKNGRFSLKPRCGIPAWIKDQNIKVCDRRSLPNLNRPVHLSRDITIFLVNERILLGQLTLSTFKSNISEKKEGDLIIKRYDQENEEILLEQTIEISSDTFSKIILNKPIILYPFVEYLIVTKWNLEKDEKLLFRTGCRDEIMIDGGIRFQFSRLPNMDYDNVFEGLICKFYFKKW